MIKKWMSTWLVALSCLGVITLALAADPPVSGTVKISSKAIAIGVGVQWGDGQLTYQGKTVPFSVEGLSVVDLGVTDITSSGEVFNLKQLSDFSGNYIAGEAGAAIASGPSDTILKNQNGVMIRLHGTQKGARLTLAAAGVTLKLKQ
jgi:hypothetical protein